MVVLKQACEESSEPNSNCYAGELHLDSLFFSISFPTFWKKFLILSINECDSDTEEFY